MFKIYLLLMLLGHILADFYTQTSSMAEKKKYKFKWVLIHCGAYFLTLLIVSIPVLSLQILGLNVIAAVCHAVIDICKYICLKNKEKKSSIVFVLDQGLHFICIIILSYIWTKNNFQLEELKCVSNFFDITNIPEILVGKWILGLLIMHKPANILIQNLIKEYKPRSIRSEVGTDNNAGRKIGTVERFIMLILLYFDQYSAIGLILTAKSIARYDQITKDKDFAEYYLLGTLLSVGITIVCAVLLF